MDDTSRAPDHGSNFLPRVLGPVEAFCVVVGSVIGSGIFLVPASVARNVPFIGEIASGLDRRRDCSAGRGPDAGRARRDDAARGRSLCLPSRGVRADPGVPLRLDRVHRRAHGSMATLAAAFARYFVQLVPPPSFLHGQIWQAGAAITGDRGRHHRERPGDAAGRRTPGGRDGPEGGRSRRPDPLAAVPAAGKHGEPEPRLADDARGVDVHGHDGGDGPRALGLRRLDQHHAAGRGDPRPGPEHPPGVDPGHGRADRRLPGHDARLPLRPAARRGHRGQQEERAASRTRSRPSIAATCWAVPGCSGSRCWSCARRLFR